MATPRATTFPNGGKARRVHLSILGEIANGTLLPGAELPGEQRLASRHAVSRVTVRRALEALAADGLIEKGAGRATTVRPQPAPADPVSMDFATLLPQIAEMGRKTTARLLAFSYRSPPAAVAAALGLPETARVQAAVRVRMLDAAPFSHLTTHVPEAVAAGYSEADLATTPLYRLLERSGVVVAEATQTITAALALPEVGAALGVPEGSALLSLTRVLRDAGGRGVEHLAALYRPDLFRLEMRLTRVGTGSDRHWEPVIGTGPPGGAET